jgi:hypothetical protein
VIGRRIQHLEGRDPIQELQQKGDYMGPIHGYTGDKPAVFFIIPADAPWDDQDDVACVIKGLAHVVSPPHSFRECPDGSLEIRNSILCTRRWKGEEWTWHGFLDQGHSWRTA